MSNLQNATAACSFSSGDESLFIGSARGSPAFDSPSSESQDHTSQLPPEMLQPLQPQCEPHTHIQCCGVEKDYRSNAWVPCEKRATFASKIHSRGVICVGALDVTKVTKCASCRNYAHANCLILQANGIVSQATRHAPWTCTTCQKIAADEKQAADAISSEGCAATGQQHKPEQDVPILHTFMSKSELSRLLRNDKWGCRSSGNGKMYMHCGLKTCQIKFSAKNLCDDTSADGDDGEWAIQGLPASHPCCGDNSKAVVVSSLVRTQAVLPDKVFKEIQRLACSHCFRSNEIQNFIRRTEGVHVHTKLIANIGYRAREKLFGGNGDLEQLYKQQKVSSLCFEKCTLNTIDTFTGKTSVGRHLRTRF